jgi:FtsH-binding integral membrane protein
MSESVHVNISYFGSVVFKEKIFNDLTKFLHFYNYLPFEEDLALYLNNLEFPLPKDDL